MLPVAVGLPQRIQRRLNSKVDSTPKARIVRGINIQIRPARLSDAPVLAEFNRRLAWETERLKLDAVTLRKGVTAVLQDCTKGLYFVAETDGTVAGQLMITYEWSDWRNGNLWWIQSVFVKEECRGHGVFRALFKYLQDLARADTGVAGLRLYMHADNAAARQTYERLGMRHSDYEVFEMDFVLNRKKEAHA